MISKRNLEKQLGFNFRSTNFLITVHPETNRKDFSTELIDNLLVALESFKEALLIFTLPNSDPGNKKIKNKIISFVKNKKNKSYYFDSLGTEVYLSVLKQVNLVIGNSSSGLLEAPSLEVPTLNIGKRQEGRLKANSVFNSGYEIKDIEKKINLIVEENSQGEVDFSNNPYGDGGATDRILNILKKVKIPDSLEKKFFDQ